jgi:predicted lipoprotein with Yx(FWY)xxD motif
MLVKLLTIAMMATAFALSPALSETLKVAEHPQLGRYLTDGSGTSLYLFEEDRRGGDRGRAVETDCVTDDCLSRWPPLGGREFPTAGDGVDASLIGSFTRPDGKKQATYNGWPLYTFAEDYVEGDVNGHDFEEFGGEWYLVTPEGGALGEPDEH